jgi:hypothetical protein
MSALRVTRRAFAGTAAVLAAPAQQAPVDIGSRRELFIDRFLIESMSGAELRLAQPLDAGTAIEFDRPWEGRFSAYATVLHDRDTYRLYYRGVPSAGKDGRDEEVTCYAESSDGARFRKPLLNLYDINGTRANNVILAGQAPLSHNFCPFLDTRPGVSAGERFKALAGIRRSGLHAFASADGVHWRKLSDAPVFTQGDFDSQNLAFWWQTERRYVCYFRVFKKIGGTGYRWVSRTTSEDFIRWTAPEEMTFGDVPPEHLYTNQTTPYFRAPHIAVAICARFMPGRQVLSAGEARAVNVDPGYYKDCSDAVFLTTRGGTRYDRTFMEAFLRPGLGLENWVSRSNYPALGVVPTGEREMSFYVVRRYGQPQIHLRRYTLRPDGFASVHAGYAGGEMRTRLLRFGGTRLEVNFATSAAGGVRVEIQDAAGRPLPGYALSDCVELIGDRVDHAVNWKSGADVARLAAQPVRLRFALKDADLYALRFA